MKTRLLDRDQVGQMLIAIKSSNGISLDSLAATCGAERSTLKRRIRWLREVYGAPITSNRKGYFWRPAPHEWRKAAALIIVFCE